MTRWLEAARRSEAAETKLTKPTKPSPAALPPVLSVKSVLSGAEAVGFEPDLVALLGLLAREGPHTYGAAAVALGIGATRAWRAEAELRGSGIRLGPLGRAFIIEQRSNSMTNKKAAPTASARPGGWRGVE